jgi:CRP-like cAMP-binding protein
MIVDIDYKKLRDASLFKGISDDVLIELARHCHLVELNAGDTLFHQDDVADALYILEAGQIHITRKYPTGEEVVLATENPFYVVGEVSMLAGRPRSGSVVAVSDCTLIGLDRATFMDVCGRHPEVSLYMLKYMGNRLYRLNLLVRENSIGNIEGRIASLVLLLSGGKDGAIPMDVLSHRVERAAAVDADTVKKTFREWVKQGYITMTGRKITVTDVAAIHNLAG